MSHQPRQRPHGQEFLIPYEKLSVGDDVRIFYRADKQMKNSRFIAPMSRLEGMTKPRMGMTDGWLLGKVVKDYDPRRYNAENKRTWPLVRYHWPLWYLRTGAFLPHEADPVEPFQPFLVEKVDMTNVSMFPLTPHVKEFKPHVGFIVFRYGGRNSAEWGHEWGETGSPVSDQFIRKFFDKGVHPNCYLNYEVWTIFIESEKELNKVADTAHLMFSPSHPIMRCKHRAALYCLYPTMYREGTPLLQESGLDRGTGYVGAEALFRCMNATERIGIQTAFPHSPNLYKPLVSKSFLHMLSLAPEYCLPACVQIPIPIILTNPKCGKKLLRLLSKVRYTQSNGKKKQPIDCGVVKLGYSWEAMDVKYFEGEEELEQVLTQMTRSGLVNQQRLPYECDNDSLILQEYIPYDMEMRMFYVNGICEGIVYRKHTNINQANDFVNLEFQEKKIPAVNRWLQSDMRAYNHAVLQAEQCVEKWMTWIEAQGCVQVPAIAFDFFVIRTEAGRCKIYLNEITESGFCTYTKKFMPYDVFRTIYFSVDNNPCDSSLRRVAHGGG